jgi:GGDEF domain-containing protein
MSYKDWLGDIGDDEARLLNLTRKDLLELPNEKLVDIIAWQQNGMEILDDRIKKTETEERHLREIVNKLSVDPNTGVFTSGALSMMNDVLIGSRILEFLKIQGFTLKLCALDVNELKRHNSIGGHEAGDIVLGEVAKRLRMLYRRRSDVVSYGLADFVGDVKGAIRRQGGVVGVQARTDKGDEMVAWRFAAPTKNDIQRGGWRASKEVERVKRGFEDAAVSYPLLQGISPDDLKRLDPESRFKIRSGIVTAPISVAFACVFAAMPTNRSEIRRIARMADEAVLTVKHQRKGGEPTGSDGVALTITDDQLNLA